MKPSDVTRSTELAAAPGSEMWVVTAPRWDAKRDGFDAAGNPQLTLMQQVCALGTCIENGDDEDAVLHLGELMHKLWARRGQSPNAEVSGGAERRSLH